MLKKLQKKLKLFVKKSLVLYISTNIFYYCLINVAQAIDLNSISQLYFFGDSLTDGGFNDLWPTQGIPGQPLPIGKAPTFTTYGGYTWAQYLARDIKRFQLPVYPRPSVPDNITNNSIYPVAHFVSATLRGINYAAGGSTTNSTGFVETWAPSLHQQVAFYLASLRQGQRLDPNAVYFIWSGANDFLTLLSQPTLPTQLQLLTTARTAAVNIANEVTLLSSRGAKRIVVMSLPNFGLTPFAIRLGPKLQASLKNISFIFDSMLNTQLGEVVRRFGTKILYVDTYSLLENVINATNSGRPFVVAGQAFYFVNVTEPACSTVLSAIYCPSTAPNNYLFADTLHPTDTAHRVISLQVETLMQNW